MAFFNQHIDILVGTFLILSAFCIFIFPPKFGNNFYGVTTNWTLKNKTLWVSGQKLFAMSIIIIGLIFFVIGNLKIHTEISSLPMFLILIALWTVSKYFVHKILQKKHNNIAF